VLYERTVSADGCACVSEELQRQKEDEERRHLEEMSEDEYDALSEEQKAKVDNQRLIIKKQRLQRSAHRVVLFVEVTCIHAKNTSIFPVLVLLM